MKKLTKKWIGFGLAMVGTVALAVGIAGCDKTNNTPTPLAAPEITLNEATGVISWTAVNHATGYDVYEGEVKATSTAETSYTITQTAEGTYTYTVAATSTDSKYSTSKMSNSVTYVIGSGTQKTPLTAPVIAIDESGDFTLLKWNAVEGAVSYKVYDGTAEVSLTYDINMENPSINLNYYFDSSIGEHKITVVAVASKADTEHSDSAKSNVVTYTAYDRLWSPTLERLNMTIYWQPINGAVAYEVSLNGTVVKTFNAPDESDLWEYDGTKYVTYEIVNPQKGANKFSIVAKCDPTSQFKKDSYPATITYLDVDAVELGLGAQGAATVNLEVSNAPYPLTLATEVELNKFYKISASFAGSSTSEDVISVEDREANGDSYSEIMLYSGNHFAGELVIRSRTIYVISYLELEAPIEITFTLTASDKEVGLPDVTNSDLGTNKNYATVWEIPAHGKISVPIGGEVEVGEYLLNVVVNNSQFDSDLVLTASGDIVGTVTLNRGTDGRTFSGLVTTTKKSEGSVERPGGKAARDEGNNFAYVTITSTAGVALNVSMWLGSLDSDKLTVGKTYEGLNITAGSYAEIPLFEALDVNARYTITIIITQPNPFAGEMAYPGTLKVGATDSESEAVALNKTTDIRYDGTVIPTGGFIYLFNDSSIKVVVNVRINFVDTDSRTASETIEKDRDAVIKLADGDSCNIELGSSVTEGTYTVTLSGEAIAKLTLLGMEIVVSVNGEDVRLNAQNGYSATITVDATVSEISFSCLDGAAVNVTFTARLTAA